MIHISELLGKASLLKVKKQLFDQEYSNFSASRDLQIFRRPKYLDRLGQLERTEKNVTLELYSLFSLLCQS